MKDLNELAMELVYKQGDITIKELKEILNQYDDKETILVNIPKGTGIIDLKILHPTMIPQICRRTKIID